MKYIPMDDNQISVSEIVLGCMRINCMTLPEIASLVRVATDKGINFFDHSDVYSDGKCEELFSQAMNFTSSERDKIYIQTKCGIRKDIGGYDFSKEHIISSTEKSLKRLKTDYINFLLLHRPDPLFDPAEVAEAFQMLYESGKVRYFGVSNFNSMQTELISKYARTSTKFMIG